MVKRLYSFEDGWTDVGPVQQEPIGWEIAWGKPGTMLHHIDGGANPGDTERIVRTAPECVHIHSDQLPPNEQRGGENALILDGNWTYKAFAAYGSFHFSLWREIEAPLGAVVTVTVPVQVHQHGNGDVGAAYWRVDLGSATSGWQTFKRDFDDRTWSYHTLTKTQTSTPLMELLITFESHTIAGIDFFLDAVEVEIEAPEPEPERGKPRLQYARVYNAIPNDATDERAVEIFLRGWRESRQTAGGSYDDAGVGDLDDRTAVLWDIPQEERVDYRDFYAAHYPDVTVRFEGEEPPTPTPEPPPPPPPPDDWTPRNYVPTGTKIGIHGVGDGGQTGDVFEPLTPLGAAPPTAKLVQRVGSASAIKALAPRTQIIGRMIDLDAVNVEWFSYHADPVAQAHQRMNALASVMDNNPDIDYWEIVNEQAPPTPVDHVKMAAFFLEAMGIAEARGVKLALFSHSTGTPEPEAWDAIADTGVFERAAAGGHAIALHEYALGGGHLYRYRDVYRRHILPRKLDIPLYITEYGVDVRRARDADYVLTQMIEYDSVVGLDPYVAGVHWYTTGEINTPYVDTIYLLWGLYRDYCIAMKDIPNGQ